VKKHNREQEEAIAHKEGPMMVLAGPGTGKTTVIAGRTEALVRSGVPASSILVVTFTRAAASEMRGRIRASLGSRADGAAIGTFHGIFYGMLKGPYHLQSGSVLGEQDRSALIRKLLASCYPGSLRESELPEAVQKEISRVKGEQIDLSHYYSASLPAETFRKVMRGYENWKKENRKIDFDDIILFCWRMLNRSPGILSFWQKKWRYILVDEFQDISPLQYSIVRMLARPEDNLFIVGDDDQSIYRFRGANPLIMLNFPKDYPDASVEALRLNYRSTPEILAFAGKVIAKNQNRYPKTIEPTRPGGKPVRLHILKNLSEEAAFLSSGIRRRMKEGEDPSGIAVLVRTNSGMRHVIERFISDRVPFRSADVIPCVYDHWAARDLISYLELGSGGRDRSDFLRIMNRPLRYISREALKDPSVSFRNLYRYYSGKDWMQKRIARLENDIRTIGTLSLYGAVCYIRKSVGYDDFIRSWASDHDVPEDVLMSVLDEVADSASNYKTFAEWKTFIAEYRSQLRERRNSREEKGGVMISTLHASKGTEYDTVYLIDVNEGVIPHKKAVLDADLEEERRMFYVGLTRARKELHLTAVKKRYDREAELSLFLDGLIPGRGNPS
jgi:DNA helicase-2/ATP-dependent DNA helicase PcrA